MKFAFYTDPSHGWLKVLTEEVKQLGIIDRITSYSYISPDRQYVYLEEDNDAQIFINAVLAADWFEDMNAIRACTKNIYSEGPSFIRKLPCFDAAYFAPVPETVKTHVHEF